MIRLLSKKVFRGNRIVYLSIALTGSINEKDLLWLSTPRSASIKNVNFNELFNVLPNIIH